MGCTNSRTLPKLKLTVGSWSSTTPVTSQMQQQSQVYKFYIKYLVTPNITYIFCFSCYSTALSCMLLMVARSSRPARQMQMVKWSKVNITPIECKLQLKKKKKTGLKSSRKSVISITFLSHLEGNYCY